MIEPTQRPVTGRGRPGRGHRRGPGATPGRRSSAGYTIAELLVVIVVTGILGAGIVSLLLGQNRFYQTNEQTLFAEESRRGAGELGASEIRMFSTSDLYKTQGDEIKGRFDLRRAVVCDVDALSSLVWLFVYEEPDISLPSGPTGTAVSSPFSADFVYEDGWTPGLNATAATDLAIKGTCTSNGAPDIGDLDRYRVVDWSGQPLPDQGSVVRVYGDLSYRFAAATSGDGLALWRNDTELVAPFAGDATFQYIMDTGNTETSVGTSNHKNISRVRVNATALGQGTNRYDVERDLEFDVSFRN